MQSRMDKYQSADKKKFERSRKNTKLYEDVYDDMYRDTTYKNMSIIDSSKKININNLKDMIDDKYDTRQYRTFKNYMPEEEEKVSQSQLVKPRKRVYDINEIINDAKNKRTFIEEAKEKQKYIDFTKRRNTKYDERYNEMENDEKELEELINTMAISKQKNETSDALDMFSDLKGEDDTVVTNPIESDLDKEEITSDTVVTSPNLEKTLVKADKTFYTDSNMFTKNDFEDFTGLSKKLNGKSKKNKVFIILLILIILGVIGYFVVTKFILK